MNQCRIKLYDYLTEYSTPKHSSFRSPVILKALLVFWLILGCVFSMQLFIFKFIDIKSKRRQLMTDSAQNYKNPIWNFFKNQDGFYDQDRQIKNATFMNKFRYPWCERLDERDEMMDIVFLAMIAYSKQKDVIENAMEIYFADNEAAEYRLQFDKLAGPPAYIHVQKRTKADNSTQDLIVIRGTDQSGPRDFYEDFTLGSEVAAITGFSKLFPITEIWPNDLIQTLVFHMSITEGIILPHASDRYYKQVKAYIAERLQNKTFNARYQRSKGGRMQSPLLIIGHSLGGLTAHVVAAQLLQDSEINLNVKSVGISNPGLIWNAKKLQIEPYLLSQIAVTVIPTLDPIPNFDKHTGSVLNIDCQSSYQEECHWQSTTFCEMFTACISPTEYVRMSAEKKVMLRKICENGYTESLDTIIADIVSSRNAGAT